MESNAAAQSNDSSAAAQSPGDSADEPAEAEEADQSSRPDQLEVPSIGLDEQVVVDLEIQPDGRLEDPHEWNDVGWFSQGPGVGDPGPTVIAGHVDSPTGPAVFYEVLDIRPGERITVTDADGSAHEYEVSRIADYPKDDFPTREVFGQQLEDELRLITCTGEFDAQAQRHLENRVVFAHAVD